MNVKTDSGPILAVLLVLMAGSFLVPEAVAKNGKVDLVNGDLGEIAFEDQSLDRDGFINATSLIGIYSRDLTVRIDRFVNHITDENQKRLYRSLRSELNVYADRIDERIAAKVDEGMTVGQAETILRGLMEDNLQSAVDTYNEIAQVNDEVIEGVANVAGLSCNYLKALARARSLERSGYRIFVDLEFVDGFPVLKVNDNYVLKKPQDLYSRNRENIEIVVLSYPAAAVVVRESVRRPSQPRPVTTYVKPPSANPSSSISNSGGNKVVMPTNTGNVKPVMPTNTGSVKPVMPTNTGKVKPVMPTNTGKVKPVMPTNTGKVKPVMPSISGGGGNDVIVPIMPKSTGVKK